MNDALWRALRFGSRSRGDGSVAVDRRAARSASLMREVGRRWVWKLTSGNGCPLPASSDAGQTSAVGSSELCRNRTEGSGDAPPLGSVGESTWQMQHDAAHRALDAATELEQPFAQGADLRSGARSALSAEAQLLHQNVGGRGEQHPQLIGEEARAAGAVDLEPMMQLLDAILDLSATAVHVIEMAG